MLMRVENRTLEGKDHLKTVKWNLHLCLTYLKSKMIISANTSGTHFVSLWIAKFHWSWHTQSGNQSPS